GDIGPKEDVPRLREALGSLKPTDRMIGIWRNRKKDGTVFDAEVLSTEVTILTRRARLALLNDVTERLRGDRHRATEIGVTRVLIDAKSFAEAAPQAIAAICQAEEWALGEVWLYDAAASVLRLDGTWHAPGLRDMHGIELAARLGRGVPEGLPCESRSDGDQLPPRRALRRSEPAVPPVVRVRTRRGRRAFVPRARDVGRSTATAGARRAAQGTRLDPGRG